MAQSQVSAVAIAAMILASGIATFTGAHAQDIKGRYSMSPVDGGFVRLDTQTGAMSHCTKSEERWNCEAMADSGGQLRDQVDRLTKENGELKAEIKRLDDMLGLGDQQRPGALDPRSGQGMGQGQGFRLPTEKEVDGALDYFENMMRKLQERLKRLEQQRDSTAPSPPPAPMPGPDAAPGTPPAGKRAL